MLTFVQATNDDILSIQPQIPQCDPKSLGYQRAAFEQDKIPLDGLAVAVRDGDHCIGAYGLVELWPGVGRVWGIFSGELIHNHPGLLALHIKRDLKRADRVLFQRIEATASPSHVDGISFLEWLGFTCEGVMKRYTPSGEDAYLYAKVNYEH